MHYDAAAADANGHREALSKVPCLKSLDADQLNKISQAVTVVRFQKGSTIIKKGDVGEAASVFYFLQKGNVIFSDTSDDSDATATLRATDEAPYFGERALLKDEPRACTVTAGSDVTCMALSRDNFTSLLGPLANMMHQEFAIRVVRTVQEFQMLSEAQFKRVVTQFKSVKVKPGQQIIKQGDPGTCMYVIISGSIEVKQNAKDDEGETIPGKEVSIIVLDAGKVSSCCLTCRRMASLGRLLTSRRPAYMPAPLLGHATVLRANCPP